MHGAESTGTDDVAAAAVCLCHRSRGAEVSRYVLMALVGAALLAGVGWAFVQRARLVELLPHTVRETVRGWRHGFRMEGDVMIPMRDGVRLATDIYFPRGEVRPRGAVLVRLPYGKTRYGEAIDAGERFASMGFVALVQDMRGRFGSEGVFTPSEMDAEDGNATLDWIVRQPWSNGRVGTFGCSSLGESQVMLATRRHPAHAAMIASAAGGANGTVRERYSFFGLYEGGIFNLASGFGWFLRSGGKTPGHEAFDGEVDVARALGEWPVAGMVSRHRPDPTDFDLFATTPMGSPRWQALGYVTPADRYGTPALHLNSWQDQTVSDTLALAEQMRRDSTSEAAANAQRVVIGPGAHCAFQWVGDAVGDLPVAPSARQPYWEWYERWFGHWLEGRSGAPELPNYLYFVMAEDVWLAAPSWPPPGTVMRRLYVADDGTLRDAVPSGGKRRFRYDPANPTPTRGGPICCTADPHDRAGPVDQREVERRPDVVTFTTDVLAEPVRVVGDLAFHVYVSSSAKDTDLVAKLVDVWPDGTALNVQEGALRLRYRDGFTAPELMEPGRVYEAMVDMRSIAHLFKAGHRIRLQVASSNFPRLERNLNTGGNNYDESEPLVAENTIHFGGDMPSVLLLPVLATPAVRAADAVR